MTLFTIGFTQKSAENLFAKLKNTKVKRVVDVGLNNTSPIAGFAKERDLKYFLNNKNLMSPEKVNKGKFRNLLIWTHFLLKNRRTIRVLTNHVFWRVGLGKEFVSARRMYKEFIEMKDSQVIKSGRVLKNG